MKIRKPLQKYISTYCALPVNEHGECVADGVGTSHLTQPNSLLIIRLYLRS